jgi:Bleomycin resistance protein-like N-terminal
MSQKSEARAMSVDMKLEVDVIPVSDVERSKQFYKRLGWRCSLRHRSGPRRARQPWHRREWGVARTAVSSGGTAQRPRPQAHQLRVLLRLQRS